MTDADSGADAHAADWLRRWDAQQTRYIPHRPERFTAMVEALAALTGRSDPTVLDLGCGPGSLSARVLERLPDATLIAVDADPLLLEIGRRAFAGRQALHWLDADLRDPAWAERIDPLRLPVDAAVSSTALHWLDAGALGSLYATLGAVIRPGGAFIDADRLANGAAAPRLDGAARAVAEVLLGEGHPDAESWTEWWTAVEADPAFADAVEERRRRAFEHPDDEAAPPLGTHLDGLRAAGFSEVGTVWQRGNDRILVAIR
ncbi:MAG: class I SAM-dependent methyltransferase [Candidatus Dormibacteria bacterium]